MKRFVTAIIVLFSVCCMAFAFTPEFDKGEAFVFDPLDYPGKAKDNFEFINQSEEYKGFGLSLYGYKDDHWELIGTSLLKGKGDSDKVKTRKRAKNYTAFAIYNNRKIPVKYVITKHRDDIIMTVVDDVQN